MREGRNFGFKSNHLSVVEKEVLNAITDLHLIRLDSVAPDKQDQT